LIPGIAGGPGELFPKDVSSSSQLEIDSKSLLEEPFKMHKKT
jgi:hypothetical protein